MSTYRIGVIPGDGIGPEVTAEAVKVLQAVSASRGFECELVTYDLGGERYLRTGEVLPDTVVEELRGLDAVLLGAVGHPDVAPGILERGLLLRLRFELELYVNLRPVKLFPGVAGPLAGKSCEDIDFVVVRENTEGLYAGSGGVLRRGTPGEVATEESVNTRFGVERVVRFAAKLAMERARRLTLCHKINVLANAGGLWKRTFDEVCSEFPGLDVDYVHVDAACLYFVTQPERFDVLVTDNLFGDIITDLGAAISGGMGYAASGNLNPERVAPSMFEPVHGSAPDIAGTGRANPFAAVLSLAMCLEFLGEKAAAERVRNAAVGALGGPGMGRGTREIGDLIAQAVG